MIGSTIVVSHNCEMYSDCGHMASEYMRGLQRPPVPFLDSFKSPIGMPGSHAGYERSSPLATTTAAPDIRTVSRLTSARIRLVRPIAVPCSIMMGSSLVARPLATR